MKYLIATAIMALPVTLSAQENCASTEDVYSIISDKFQEQRVLSGISLSGYVTEIWLNADSGSWTAIVTHPNGISCVADEGTDGTRIPMKGNL